MRRSGDPTPADTHGSDRLFRCGYLSSDIFPAVSLGDSEIMLDLEIHPELRRVAKISPKPKCRIRTNGSFALNNLADPSGRNSEVVREAVDGKPAYLQFVFEDLAGMCRDTFHLIYPS